MTSASVSDLYASDRWPHRPVEDLLPPGAVLVSAVGGSLAGLHPTGSAPADAVVGAVLAAGAALAGSAVPAPWLLAPLLLGVVASGGSIFGLVALGAAAALLVRLARGDGDAAAGLVGSAAAGIAVQSLLRLDDLGGTGRSAVVAAVGLATLAAPAWSRVPASARGWARRGAVVAGGLAVVTSALAALALWRAADPLAEGEATARQALDALRDGDTERAAALLDQAVAQVGEGRARLGVWWAAPARLVPISGLQSNAALAVAEEADALVGAAADLLVVLEDTPASATPASGVDLDRLDELRPVLLQAAMAVERAAGRLAEVDSPWLAPPLAHRIDDLRGRLDPLVPDARLGVRALDVVPGLLGRDAPTRFLVLFGTPSETREGGGIVANVVEVVADGGHLTLERSARNLELNDASTATGLTDPGSYPTRFVENEPWLFAQNWTGTSDFPTAARAVGELYPQMGGTAVDAVVYIDPFGLEALLELTGPVVVPGLVEPLTAETAAEFLLVGQYVSFPDLTQRVDFLDGAAHAVFDALTTTTDLSDVAHVLDVMRHPVAGRHVMVASFDPATQALLDDVGVSGRFPTAPATDQLAVIQANASADKLDAFLQRDIAYDVTVDPDSGAFTGAVTITLTNSVPPGMPPYVVGEPYADLPAEAELLLVSISTPAELVAASIDGQPWAVEQRIEHGLRRLIVPLSVLPGTPVVVRYEIAGQLPGGPGDYELRWVNQTMVNPDRVTVTVSSTDGRAVSGVEASAPLTVAATGPTATVTGTIDRDATVAVSFG